MSHRPTVLTEECSELPAVGVAGPDPLHELPRHLVALDLLGQLAHVAAGRAGHGQAAAVPTPVHQVLEGAGRARVVGRSCCGRDRSGLLVLFVERDGAGADDGGRPEAGAARAAGAGRRTDGGHGAHRGDRRHGGGAAAQRAEAAVAVAVVVVRVNRAGRAVGRVFPAELAGLARGRVGRRGGRGSEASRRAVVVDAVAVGRGGARGCPVGPVVERV